MKATAEHGIFLVTIKTSVHRPRWCRDIGLSGWAHGFTGAVIGIIVGKTTLSSSEKDFAYIDETTVLVVS
jgi:hypothetical protein